MTSGDCRRLGFQCNPFTGRVCSFSKSLGLVCGPLWGFSAFCCQLHGPVGLVGGPLCGGFRRFVASSSQVARSCLDRHSRSGMTGAGDNRGASGALCSAPGGGRAADSGRRAPVRSFVPARIVTQGVEGRGAGENGGAQEVGAPQTPDATPPRVSAGRALSVGHSPPLTHTYALGARRRHRVRGYQPPPT